MNEPVRVARTAPPLAVLLGVVLLSIAGSRFPSGASAAVLATIVLVLLVVRSSESIVWTIALILALPSDLFPSMGSLGSDAAYKGMLLLLILILASREGVSERTPIVAIVVLLLVGYSLALLDFSGHEIGFVTASKGAFGYVYYWVGGLIAWRSGHSAVVLRAIRIGPLVSVVLGTVLGPWLGVAAVRTEYTGVARLAGFLIPAHVAMYGLIAVFTSLVLLFWDREDRFALFWVLVNALIVFLTLTRGASIAAILTLFFAGIAASTRSSTGKTRRSIAALTLGVTVASLVTLPSFLERSAGNSYEGRFNSSGREAAWQFYLGVARESPWFGHGPGYANVAVRVNDPSGVQSAFEAPHNEFLHFYVDLGIPLSVMLFLLLIMLWRAVGAGLRVDLKVLWYGFGVASLAYAFLDNPLSTPQYSAALGLVISALYGLAAQEQQLKTGDQ